jgi:hypothetical protein
VYDIQEDSSNSIDIEIHDSTADVVLAYDAQALDPVNQSPVNTDDATLIKVMVSEFTGGLTIQDDTATGKASGKVAETIELNVADTLVAPSTLKFVTNLTGGKTLNIVGGIATGDFTITAPLDAQLTTIGAGAFLGDLILDTTATATATLINLGKGDDKLNMGDQLGDGDVVNGGDGKDAVTINLTTNTDFDRMPTMTGVETLNAAFNAAALFDGSMVDGLDTINLAASANRAGLRRNGQDADHGQHRWQPRRWHGNRLRRLRVAHQPVHQHWQRHRRHLGWPGHRCGLFQLHRNPRCRSRLPDAESHGRGRRDDRQGHRAR